MVSDPYISKPETIRLVREYLLYSLLNAELLTYPFPHFYAKDCFPEFFYRHLLHHLPADYKQNGEGKYHGRTFGVPPDFLNWMLDPVFAQTLIGKFHPWAAKRFQQDPLVLRPEIRMVRDCKGYHISPHTDAAWKVISLLFYLPLEPNFRESGPFPPLPNDGTSLYIPNDPTFTCPGGPHHRSDQFQLLKTFPFVRNTCFGFWKTNNSFHGVEPIEHDCQRDVLLYNLYDMFTYKRVNGLGGEAPKT